MKQKFPFCFKERYAEMGNELLIDLRAPNSQGQVNKIFFNLSLSPVNFQEFESYL